MFNELYINDILLPRPKEDITFKNDKKKTEYETEAGTTQVLVTRTSKIKITAKFLLTGTWMKKFREFESKDTVIVSCFYPSESELSEHECQFIIDSENHIAKSREQLNVNGLYEVSISLEEL